MLIECNCWKHFQFLDSIDNLTIVSAQKVSLGLALCFNMVLMFNVKVKVMVKLKVIVKVKVCFLM